MTIEEAQRDVRATYLGGFPGQIISGLIWIASASFATWSTPKVGMWFLVIGGMFIFPITKLVLRVNLSHPNPLNGLAMQVAFTIPLTLPLAGAAALHRLQWFYPAVLLIVGAHYLPFVTLYGMRVYAVLSGAMIASGLVIALYMPSAPFALGGWIGGAMLIVFGVAGLALRATAKPSPSPA
jgi:hypothetical protein